MDDKSQNYQVAQHVVQNENMSESYDDALKDTLALPMLLQCCM